MVDPIEGSVFLESVVWPFDGITDTEPIKERIKALECEVRSTKRRQPQFRSAWVDEIIAMMLEEEAAPL